MKKFSRRKFVTLLGLGALGTAGYGGIIESSRFIVSRHQVRLGRFSGRAPIRILHMSDLHASMVVGLDQIAEAVELGLKCEPHLVCLTGDFITRRYERFDEYAAVLAPLAKHAPTFACLGNHDGGAWAQRRRGYSDTASVRALLAKSGVQLLHNASVAVRLDGWQLTVTGLGDYWAGELQPEVAFRGADPESARLVLVHNPDSIEELRRYGWDLMLCGHTHGGQLRLPVLGTPFAPVKDHRLVDGLHNCDGRWVHITRGVGNLLGIRINCPPEVSLITLVG
ncbi:MAG: phosphodiesterase YaeI [Verrucomicrobiae bacterium]|nr:phosphodiesterase YaeI [Verrucomicrobiae bacterium]